MRTKGIVGSAALVAAACFSVPAAADVDCSTSSGQLDLRCIVRQNNLEIDKSAISVSGISSGAFMAHQFHVAHSAHIMGVGVVAGGPYYCAEGNITDAISKCSEFMVLTCQQQLRYAPFGTSICSLNYTGPRTDDDAVAVAGASFAEAQRLSGILIDDVAGLSKAKVYLFRGEADKIVPLGVMQSVYHFYVDKDKADVNPASVAFNDTFTVRHSMVTDNFYEQGMNIVGPCNPRQKLPGDSYIADCRREASQVEAQNECVCGADGCRGSTPQANEICNDASHVDLAGAILAQIYGQLNSRARLAPPELQGAALDAALGKYVQPFDQAAIFSSFDEMPKTTLLYSSMAETGYVYIPESCKTAGEHGGKCGLHVAFHGCLQGGDTGDKAGGGYSGNLYSKYAGYNEWAKTNNIVILYPQVRSWNSGPLNPQGCWDWWGQYYTHDYYHTKAGLQIKAIAQMINVLVDDDQFLDVPRSGR